MDAAKAVYKYANGKFLLLDSSLYRIDTVVTNEAWTINEVIDVKMYGNKCILI